MDYYAKDLEEGQPVTLVASGHYSNRTVHLYPSLNITSLEDWEVVMRDDGKAGLSFFDEQGDRVPSEILLKWIDQSEELTYMSHEKK